MNDIIKNTLAEIKNQGIKPFSRKKFLVRRYLKWALVFLAAVIGSLALAAAVYLLSQLDWDAYRFLHRNFLVYAFSILPYFWLIFFAAFLALAFRELRRTDQGYRFSWAKMLSIVSLMILGAATLAVIFNLGGRLHGFMLAQYPRYGHMVYTKERQWSQPESGFLAGRIDEVEGNSIYLRDLAGKKWEIRLDSSTLIRPSVSVRSGEIIKIMGKAQNGGIFQALEVRPWMGRGMMQGSGPRKGGGMMGR